MRYGAYVGKKEGHLNGADDSLRLGDQYVFVIHSSLRMTPAMAAGITDSIWDIRELLN